MENNKNIPVTKSRHKHRQTKLFVEIIFILFYTYFYCIIKGTKGHTFHYNYVLYYYIWQINLNLT